MYYRPVTQSSHFSFTHLAIIVLDIRLILLLHFNITITQKKNKKNIVRLHPLSIVLIIFACNVVFYFVFPLLVFDFATKLNLACEGYGLEGTTWNWGGAIK